MRELPCRLPHRVSFILAGLSCPNVWYPAPCGSQSHLDGNSEKTIVTPCVWSEVSKVSSSVDCSERLGDHLQRSAFLKLHEITLWPQKMKAVEIRMAELVVIVCFVWCWHPEEHSPSVRSPSYLEVRWVLLGSRCGVLEHLGIRVLSFQGWAASVQEGRSKATWSG